LLQREYWRVLYFDGRAAFTISDFLAN
jgi:hypothetical protein